MKRVIRVLLCGVLAVAPLLGVVAQSKSDLKIPISIYLPDGEKGIPSAASSHLANKITMIAAQNGMGATDDFAQFYVTTLATVLDQHVIPGAPTKYSYELDLTFHIVDAFAKKIFNSTSITVKGVGNSAEQAYINAFRRIPPANQGLKEFFLTTNKKIVNYYESQRETIINKALSLAKVYQYEEALFHLSLYPEACAGYERVVEVATGIYQKYIDDLANRNLAKARSIWNAGLNAEAASEAGVYLAEIMPEASCYVEAVKLSDEIKERVGSDIDYLRSLEARDNAQMMELADKAYKVEMARVAAWKEVGITFGANQREHTYNNAWLFR